MAKTPVKQVTITLTIQTRARERTIERWVKEGLVKTIRGVDWDERGSYEIQQILIEDVINGNFRRVRLAQLNSRVDHLLEEIEGLVDDGLEELEKCYEAIGVFEEQGEQE